jgi:hypothetical protein
MNALLLSVMTIEKECAGVAMYGISWLYRSLGISKGVSVDFTSVPNAS